MKHPAPEGGIPPEAPVRAFSASAYEHRLVLTKEERAVLAHLVAYPHGKWEGERSRVLAPLLRPVYDCLRVAGCESSNTLRRVRWPLIAQMGRLERPYWAWSAQQWEDAVRATATQSRTYAAALAYHLGGLDGLRVLRLLPDHTRIATRLARKVFGKEAVDEALAGARETVTGWGYSGYCGALSRLNQAVSRALLAARSPKLEDIRMEHLESVLRFCGEGRSSGVVLLSRILASLGIVEEPLGSQDSGIRWWTASDEEGVPEAWLGWCRRWREHSTLMPSSRKGVYSRLLQTGRWLAANHPGVDSPEGWDGELAAEFVAAVDKKETGQWARSAWTRIHPEQIGKPLRPSTKSGFLGAVKRFFKDCQEWSWIPVRFDPERYLRAPSSVRRLLGPDPRVIDDAIWARLVGAALELSAEDFHPRHLTPIEMDRALAALWVCCGLRSEEVARLRVGCVRWQSRDAKVAGTGEVLKKEEVCFLDVPANKTSTAFTKPVPTVVGRRINEWEQVRPADQQLALDEKTSEKVHFLFSIRNSRLHSRYLNNMLIPALCRKAGVPRRDARGKITSHRARATIASQLNTGPEPLTLSELQAFLGHADPRSTRHYVKVDPTRLARKYADSGYLERNLAMVEVLLDVEALTEGHSEDVLYYDLGHGLCANPYWHQCPYRMACVRCPMYVPGQEAQYVRAKKGIRRMLETVPMTDEEKRAAEGDEQALNELLSKNSEIPMPVHSASRKPIVPLSSRLRHQSS